jgi:hypothetical protein
VLNWESREDEGEQILGVDFCGYGYLLGERRNLVSGIHGERCHSQFRAKYADIKEVKTTNSKVSAKQENESSPHPPYHTKLAHSDFCLLGCLKDAF